MKRRIIEINEEKCNGCGLCAAACHEGAIGMAGGKARLLRDDYCDGLGDCLPACPTGAITFTEREAAEYNGVGRPAQFPIQLKLVSPRDPRFRGAELTVAADCTAFMRRELELRQPFVIACPKLDGTDYSEKLAEIITCCGVKAVTVLRMEVPCCGGLVRMAEEAIELSGAKIPLKAITVTVGGAEKQ
ncbi:MAG: 4Fe-4S binding protein [Oscillospiraceae bacterium]|nr:4Fe-4S binding protein [Oscillospiraceae bacterium]